MESAPNVGDTFFMKIWWSVLSLLDSTGQWRKRKRDLTNMKVRPQGTADHAELLYWIIHIVLILINPLCLANFSHRVSFLKNCNYQWQHLGHVGWSVSCRQELYSVKAFSPFNPWRSLPHCNIKDKRSMHRDCNLESLQRQNGWL